MGLLFLITSLHLPLSRIVLFLWPVCPLQPLCNLFILSRVFFSFPVLPCPHLEAHPPSPLITSPYHFNLAFFDTSTTLNAPLTAALLVLLFFFFFFFWLRSKYCPDWLWRPVYLKNTLLFEIQVPKCNELSVTMICLALVVNGHILDDSLATQTSTSYDVCPLMLCSYSLLSCVFLHSFRCLHLFI